MVDHAVLVKLDRGKTGAEVHVLAFMVMMAQGRSRAPRGVMAMV